MLRCYDKLLLTSWTLKKALRNLGMRILQLSREHQGTSGNIREHQGTSGNIREHQGTLYLPVLLGDKREEAFPSHCSTKQSSSSAGSTPADSEVLKLETWKLDTSRHLKCLKMLKGWKHQNVWRWHGDMACTRQGQVSKTWHRLEKSWNRPKTRQQPYNLKILRSRAKAIWHRL